MSHNRHLKLRQRVHLQLFREPSFKGQRWLWTQPINHTGQDREIRDPSNTNLSWSSPNLTLYLHVLPSLLPWNAYFIKCKSTKRQVKYIIFILQNEITKNDREVSYTTVIFRFYHLFFNGSWLQHDKRTYVEVVPSKNIYGTHTKQRFLTSEDRNDK